MNDDREVADDGLGDYPPFDGWPSFRPPYLRTERKHFVAIVNHRRTVDGGQSANHVDRASQLNFPLPPILVVDFLSEQVRQRGEIGAHRVQNRLRYRFAPALRSRGYDEQAAAMTLRPHRSRELDQDVQ